jgi:hypothetical protein
VIIRDTIWLEEIEEKIIRKHNVWPEEAEEALRNRLRVRFIERGHRRGEDIYAAFGQSKAGRYLVVYFILKQENIALILSARDMTTKERKTYGSK